MIYGQSLRDDALEIRIIIVNFLSKFTSNFYLKVGIKIQKIVVTTYVAQLSY